MGCPLSILAERRDAQDEIERLRSELEQAQREISRQANKIQHAMKMVRENEEVFQSVSIEQETSKEKAEAEALPMRYKEALAKLEETGEALERETGLRIEAEERVVREAVAKQEALAALRKAQQGYTEYNIQELEAATGNFDEAQKLGEGRTGCVYRGKIHHTNVAIKVINPEEMQGPEQFQREVELLSRLHHPHMVMLLGACPESGCIVYEYMANGSLEDRLRCKDGTPPLPWYVRFKICFEVATALLFLHSREEPIVHRDIKPANILLDHNFVSKISDVGLAKLVPNNLSFSVTRYRDTTPAGTIAYIDPDYVRTGVVSRESDVYALGLVMLQLLTGKSAVGVGCLVEQAVDNARLAEVLDESAGEWPLVGAMELACLSLQCIESRRTARPHLENIVLTELESIRAMAEQAHTCSGSSFASLIPGLFICPISQAIMEDPYIAADGFTYEREQIKAWLDGHDTSPMTNLRLSHKNLVPNHSLRSTITEWQDNGIISTRI